jgi:YVTN family beta-propeller protein
MSPRIFRSISLIVAVAASVARADEPLSPRLLPGVRPDRSVLLPNQWSLRPAGRQVELGNFPVNVAVHPQGNFAAVLHSGYGPHVVSVVDLKTAKVVSSETLPKTFYGLCFTPDGERLLVSGGEDDVIYVFHFADGKLSGCESDKLPRGQKAAIPTGIACSRDGERLYVACCQGHVLKTISLKLDLLWPSSINLPAESWPYAALPAGKSGRLYVSLWGNAAIAVVDAKSQKIEATWPAAPHPTEMALSPDESLLYVACADANCVVVLDTATGRQVEVIGTALYPRGPARCTPMSLALAPNGKTLWVANADANNLAVLDVSHRGESRSLGFIPVGWYPTSVRMTPAADQVLVANGKGVISRANPQGPNPTRKRDSEPQYIGGLLRGTLSVIPMPKPGDMPELTRAAYACSPLKSDTSPTGRAALADNPIPAAVGRPSPIKHCVYIIKENRTYDQVLGDVREGNGDASLCLFPERVTPNEHAIARQFVLLDNFYVDGEVSANGHEWSTAAYANDYVEKVWPQVYRRKSEHGEEEERGFPYPSQAHTPIGCAASGYIWDRCRAAGVAYRNYGEFVENAAKPGDPGHARLKALEGHFDPLYRAFDLNYSDQLRADRFIAELQRFEREGTMSGLVIVWLPNDHTSGTTVGKPTPRAYAADNDLALGRIVEAVSHGKFWKETAIFVLEDDAQNGPDHVDAHRSTAYVISPYTKRRAVDSSMYSTSSMLRTMELILGLRPMTQFDAAARPMYASFQSKPDFTPYTHLPANVDLGEKNDAAAYGAAESGRMDFRDADAADDRRLNEIIWRSVRGARRPMPAPVHAAFFLPNGE